MQTFLPYPDFARSAAVLDNKRLGKQRVENLQILKTLLNPNATAWKNHPCVRMWRGYEQALLAYQITICTEWISKGFNDTCLDKSLVLFNQDMSNTPLVIPSWFGNERLHSSHRSNLKRKDPIYYKDFPDDPTAEYYWPV